ncbi:LOW QUALITY PROTEIN: hypothetical protein V2J09_017621 [Rumex salicifolius]
MTNFYKPKDISTSHDMKFNYSRMIGRKPSKKNKKKAKKDMKKKSSITGSGEEYVPPNRVPITLKDFVPKGLLKDNSSEDDTFWGDGIAPCCMTRWADICEEGKLEVDEITLCSERQLAFSKVKGKKNKKSRLLVMMRKREILMRKKSEARTISSRKTRRVPLILHNTSFKEKFKYDVIGHLKHIPVRLSVYDALQMSNELRRALIQALMEPDNYKDQVDRVEVNDVSLSPPTHCASCMERITFSDEDLQLGEEYHNRLLYVKVLKSIGLNTRHLSPTFLTIQGFNQVGKRAMGSIVLKVMMEDLYKDVLFHVIDADTSYKALLGRPWLHASKSIISTLHQCLKYTDENGNEKTI